MKTKISKKESVPYGRAGVSAFNYSLPDVNEGSSVIYAELTGIHGERTIGDRSRIYYILDGSGEYVINGEKFFVEPGDVVTIPPHATYNYWPTQNTTLKCVLFMELLDLSKLPK